MSVADSLTRLAALVADDPAVVIGPLLGEQHAGGPAQAGIDQATIGPLQGVPFAVKDNIDVAGVPTTAACPSFAYLPLDDATIVARLRAAGAVPVAKTNLDQFATGLVGTRSPYGTPRNPLAPHLVPGGSSSGSAVAVARGAVPFALGTDTAGSGRVPAALCAIVGFKPTVGRLPITGIVPAVRRIDCPTVFAQTVGLARAAIDAMAGPDRGDPFSRVPARRGAPVRRVGVPTQFEPGLLEPPAADAFADASGQLSRCGLEPVPVDIAPLLAAGRLLYGGPIVAERLVGVAAFLAGEPSGLDPTVAAIIRAGVAGTALDAYQTEYALAEARAHAAELWAEVDALLLPTTPGVASLEAVAADPLGVNSWLGTFTTFVNLLDCAAVALPLGDRPDGLPSGVQLIGPAWSDDALADAAAALLGEPAPPAALRAGELAVTVVGAHLSGMPLNGQLTARGGRLVETTTTAPTYRLYHVAGTVPPKPGLVRAATGGAPIAVEVWALPEATLGSFLTEIPPPLGLGQLQLADGTWRTGFICEPCALEGSADITHHGGWRAYLASGEAAR